MLILNMQAQCSKEERELAEQVLEYITTSAMVWAAVHKQGVQVRRFIQAIEEVASETKDQPGLAELG